MCVAINCCPTTLCLSVSVTKSACLCNCVRVRVRIQGSRQWAAHKETTRPTTDSHTPIVGDYSKHNNNKDVFALPLRCGAVTAVWQMYVSLLLGPLDAINLTLLLFVLPQVLDITQPTKHPYCPWQIIKKIQLSCGQKLNKYSGANKNTQTHTHREG